MNNPFPHLRCPPMISTLFLSALCLACSPNSSAPTATTSPTVFSSVRSLSPSVSKTPTQKTATSKTVTSMSEIILSNADNGKTITVKPGQTIKLQLNENPTTGYRWSMAPFNTQRLQLTDDRFDLPKSSGMGGGGQRLLTFQATQVGQVNLNLNNKREWEDSAVESFNLTLEIRE